jgi:hypothetical protein
LDDVSIEQFAAARDELVLFRPLVTSFASVAEDEVGTAFGFAGFALAFASLRAADWAQMVLLWTVLPGLNRGADARI